MSTPDDANDDDVNANGANNSDPADDTADIDADVPAVDVYPTPKYWAEKYGVYTSDEAGFWEPHEPFWEVTSTRDGALCIVWLPANSTTEWMTSTSSIGPDALANDDFDPFGTDHRPPHNGGGGTGRL